MFICSKKELGFKKISSALSSGLTGRQDSGSWLNRHLHEKDLGVLIEGRLRMIPRCEPESRGSLSRVKETLSPGKGRSQPPGLLCARMLMGLVQLLSKGISGGKQSGQDLSG